jgi:hypothetical protein
MPDATYSDDQLRQYAEGQYDEATNQQIEAYLLTHPVREQWVRAYEAQLVANILAQAGSEDSPQQQASRAKAAFDARRAAEKASPPAGLIQPFPPETPATGLRSSRLRYLLAAAVVILVLVGLYRIVAQPPLSEQMLALASPQAHLTGPTMGSTNSHSRLDSLLILQAFDQIRTELAPLVREPDTSTQPLTPVHSQELYAYGLSLLYADPREAQASLPWFSVVRRRGQGPAIRRYAGLQLAVAHSFAGQPEVARQTLRQLLREEDYPPAQATAMRDLIARLGQE